MEEINKDNLHRAIQQLAPKGAPPNAWENLEKALDADEEMNASILQKAIQELPQKRFEKNIFEEIIQEANEEVEEKPIQKPLKRIHWVTGIAASVTLLIGFWLGNLNSSTTIEISYSEQVVEQETAFLPILKTQLHEEDEVLKFIQSNCKTVQQTCERPDFKELLEEYIALENDRKELLKTIKENQEPEKLMKYLVRVEKKKTELGKQLMQKLI